MRVRRFIFSSSWNFHCVNSNVTVNVPAATDGEPASGTEGTGELLLTGSTKLGEQGTRWQVGDDTAIHVAR